VFPCPRAPEPDPASTRRATALVSAFSSCCLFRAPSQSPPLTLFRERAHCRSFVPQRDITRSVHSLPRGFQPSLRSVLGCSQPLDGFLRFRAPRLVSSSSRVQGSPSFRGFSLHAAPLPLVEGGGPPAVVATGAPQTLRPGAHTSSASASRLCSARRCVHTDSVINLTGGRSPLRVRLLQAHHPPAR